MEKYEHFLGTTSEKKMNTFLPGGNMDTFSNDENEAHEESVFANLSLENLASFSSEQNMNVTIPIENSDTIVSTGEHRTLENIDTVIHEANIHATISDINVNTVLQSGNSETPQKNVNSVVSLESACSTVSSENSGTIPPIVMYAYAPVVPNANLKMTIPNTKVDTVRKLRKILPKDYDDENDDIPYSKKIKSSTRRRSVKRKQVQKCDVSKGVTAGRSQDYISDFKCDICEKCFVNKHVLRRHSFVHVSKKPYACTICEKSFVLLGSLQEHLHTHSGERPYGCVYCKKRFYSKKGLEKHTKTRHPEENSCDVCQMAFKSENDLQRHYSIHKACDICDKRFITKMLLEAHRLVHIQTGEKPFVCDICKKSFSKKKFLCNHYQMHKKPNRNIKSLNDLTQKGKHICDICGKGFPQKCSLWVHQRTHESKKLYECTICPRKFTRKKFHIRHYQTHNVVVPFPCSLCNKKFASKLGLQNHISIHHEGRPLQDINETLSENSNRLQNISHLETSADLEKFETGIKQLFQSEIEEEFEEDGGPVQNLSADSEEKQFSCDVCGKTFSKKYLLKRHSYIHASQKPHVCDICHKSFTQKASLNEHYRTHTGETYGCTVCDKKFASKNGLNKHTQTHIGKTAINPQDYEESEDDSEDSSPDATQSEGMLFQYFVQQWENPQGKNAGAASKPSGGRASKVVSPRKTVRRKQSTPKRDPNERPFKCDVCGKDFAWKGSLNYHYKSSHTSDRPHKCDICGKGFLQKTYLRRHEITHEFEKQYECNICHKKLATRSNLDDHYNVHKDVKPYNCDICDAQFATKSAKKRHYQVFHEDIKHVGINNPYENVV